MIFKFIKPFKFTIFLIVILTFGQVIADLMLPNFMAQIVDKGVVSNDVAFILRTSAWMILMSVIGITLGVGGGFLASRTALKIGTNLRNSLLKKITNYSLEEFDSLGTASLITRSTNDALQIENTIYISLRMMMRAPIMCIGAAIMAVNRNSHLSLLLLIILPIIFILIFLVSRKVVPLFRTMQKRLDKINMILRENLVGIRIIRAFGRVGYEKRRFAKANSDLTDTAISANRIMAILNPAMALSTNLLIVGIIWTASYMINSGSLMVGDLMAFIQYAFQILMSLMMMTMMFIMLPRAFASAERLNQVFDNETKIVDPQSPVITKEKNGQLEFKSVVFSYSDAENPAINDVSFAVKSGEIIGIVGGTGSGKSTLLKLMLRYYDANSGKICIDGSNICKISQEDLRNRISYVGQEGFLFSGTIIDNIRMGRQDATEDEIKHACQIGQASSFIEQLPDLYYSAVAQSGTNFSGGQKQRIEIARALVRKADIYMFDDSFSALDFKTDAIVRAGLKQELKDTTTIIVAQRISSIMNADRILVMDKGSLIGTGTHKELLQSNEVYKEIALSQLSEKELSQ